MGPGVLGAERGGARKGQNASPDIRKAISEMCRVSSKFYFNMFKWKMKSGNLKSQYHKNKKYFSTYFNIDKLLSLINLYGKIEDAVICFENEEKEEEKFDVYRQNYTNDIHRTSDYLSIYGTWK